MPLSERRRPALDTGLVEVVHDQQAVEELSSYFPARDVEEPVTKEFLPAEMGDLRAEFASFRADVQADLHRQTAWLIATAVALAGVLVAAGAISG